MKLETVSEGQVKLDVPSEKHYKLDSKMPVFFNPIMKKNRDLNVVFLRALGKKRLRVLDLLSGTGVRGLRLAKEVPNTEVTCNDLSRKAADLIRKNTKKNKLKIMVENKPANLLLAELKSYDFIDIDPFGTPIHFLDDAVKRLSPHAILSVTATDTSALAGTYPKACLRKYGSRPLRNEFMHETGLRILIKKVQEVAAQYDVGLVPVFCHSSDHYMRVYLEKFSSATAANKVLEEHGYILYCWSCCYRKPVKSLLKETEKCPKCKSKLDYAGPLWLGKLWNSEIVKKMLKLAPEMKILQQISEEMQVNSVGFYDIHRLAKKQKMSKIPKISIILKKIQPSTRTHFSPTGLRTTKEVNLSQI